MRFLTKSRAFYGQIPIILLCTLFVAIRLPSFLNDTLVDEAEDRDDETKSRRSPVWELDFAGIFTFSGTILILLFFLEALGMLNEENVLQTALLGLAFVSGCIIFILIELFWAEKPLIPIRILSIGIGAHFLLQVLLLGGRSAVCSSDFEIRMNVNASPARLQSRTIFHPRREHKRLPCFSMPRRTGHRCLHRWCCMWLGD